MLRFVQLSFRSRSYIPFSDFREPKIRTPRRPQGDAEESSDKVGDPNLSKMEEFKCYQPLKSPNLLSPYMAVSVLKAFMPPQVNRMNRLGNNSEMLQTAGESKIEVAAPQAITLRLLLDVNLKHHSVRGTCKLPYPNSEEPPHLLVICPDDVAPQMIAAGADAAGLTLPLENISRGKINFDRVVTTPDMMPLVTKVAKILGPRKLMPNPKSGTVVTDLVGAIKELKEGSTVEFRAVNDGEVAVLIGTSHTEGLLANMKAFVRQVLSHQPRASSGDSDLSNKGLEFVWPPPRNKAGVASKSSRDLTSDISLGSGKNKGFLMGASLESLNGLKVGISPSLLMPDSIGYYR